MKMRFLVMLAPVLATLLLIGCNQNPSSLKSTENATTASTTEGGVGAPSSKGTVTTTTVTEDDTSLTTSATTTTATETTTQASVNTTKAQVTKPSVSATTTQKTTTTKTTATTTSQKATGVADPATGISWDGVSPIIYTYEDGTTGTEPKPGATYQLTKFITVCILDLSDAPEYDGVHCVHCGKVEGDGSDGTCLRYIGSNGHNCDHCGVFVAPKTCHTCEN